MDTQASGGTFYEERKTYLYKTERRLDRAKDLKLNGDKQPAIAAGVPPVFQGSGGKLVARAFRRDKGI